jgi:hypothetical protein
LQAQLRKSLGVFVDADAQQGGGATEPCGVFALELPSRGRGRRGASASRLSENGGIDAPPFISEVGAIRQTIVEQHSQFLSLERVERFVRVRPPPNGPPRKTAQAQPVASAVIGEEFEGSPGTIAENEHNDRERILIELPFAQGGERIDALSESAIRSPETE